MFRPTDPRPPLSPLSSLIGSVVRESPGACVEKYKPRVLTELEVRSRCGMYMNMYNHKVEYECRAGAVPVGGKRIGRSTETAYGRLTQDKSETPFTEVLSMRLVIVVGVVRYSASHSL